MRRLAVAGLASGGGARARGRYDDGARRPSIGPEARGPAAAAAVDVAAAAAASRLVAFGRRAKDRERSAESGRQLGPVRPVEASIPLQETEKEEAQDQVNNCTFSFCLAKYFVLLSF